MISSVPDSWKVHRDLMGSLVWIYTELQDEKDRKEEQGNCVPSRGGWRKKGEDRGGQLPGLCGLN